MRHAITIAAVGLAAAALTACSSSDAAPADFDVHGSVSTTGSNVSYDGHCSSAYGSIGYGTDVRITDADGKLAGHGTLERQYVGNGKRTNVNCIFLFTVPQVAAGSKLYDVTIGGERVGTYTPDQLHADLILKA